LTGARLCFAVMAEESRCGFGMNCPPQQKYIAEVERKRQKQGLTAPEIPLS